MHRDEQVRIARRLLAHSSRTAPRRWHRSQCEIPISRYTDPELWADEVERFYKRLPIVAGMSCELPEPGSLQGPWRSWGSLCCWSGMPRGSAKAFLNVCRHRGAPVATGCGRTRRLTCPYHAWTYDLSGRLVGVTSEESFGPVDEAIGAR